HTRRHAWRLSSGAQMGVHSSSGFLFRGTSRSRSRHILRLSFVSFIRRSPISTLFPYTTLFRSHAQPGWCTITNKFFSDILIDIRSEEHTSELQSRFELVCRLLLENNNSDRLAITVDEVVPTLLGDRALLLHETGPRPRRRRNQL